METEIKSMAEAVEQKGLLLAEKWEKIPGKMIRGFESAKSINFMEGIDKDDVWNRAVTAQLLENALRWVNSLDEATRSLHVGSFEKFVFPLIRAVLANLMASEWVTVHPLDAPTGLVFYLDALYGSTKGNIPRGSKMFDARVGPSTDIYYTTDKIEAEQIAVGGGDAATANVSLSYTPVRPGTVMITDGAKIVQDDGNGGFVGDVGVGASTINYNSGAVSITWSGNVDLGTPVTASYEYNSEANDNIPEIDLQITSSPIVARPSKLRARWSIEAQQDLQSYHGINAEVEIVALMANVIAKEINYSIRHHLESIATAGHTTWERTPGAGVHWVLHRETLYDAMVECSNRIFSATQRANGNYVIAGVGVCNVLECLSKFSGNARGTEGTAGVRKIGKLGEFDVFKDPGMTANRWLMGYKSSNWLDTGYIWAPYQALYTSPTIVLDDMIGRKAMMQRYGRKVVNSNMYATGLMTQGGGPFAP